MADARQAAQNFQALKEKSFDIHFHLEDTDYESIENIGTGAYGVVCSAINCKTKEKVAIKKIPRIFEQLTIAKRTYREIKILRHFKHDNIIAIRDILQTKEGTLQDVYIVLDLMESDLHRIIHSQQPLTEEHIRYFLYQILRGLKYIHSANVVHRDLKPSNLLVNENCDLKIGDFGMARGFSSAANEENLRMTQYVATRWYRAPELMLLPMAYTAAIDVWSVGCILAEMIGRRQIFPGRDYRDQLRLIIGILGSPSADFMKLTHSDIVRNFIFGLGVKKAESLESLYSKASPKVLKLLKTMLVIDPNKRCSVEQALAHPFLSKYHDPDDEPICIPVFNFDFEKESLDAPRLKEVITEEIRSFRTPKPRVSNLFNLIPVPKSELAKSKPMSPPVKQTATVGQAAPLFSRIKDDKSQDDGRSAIERLIQQHSTIPPTQAMTVNIEDKKVNEAAKASADVIMLSATEPQKGDKDLSVEQKTDVEMPSAKIKEENECNDSLLQQPTGVTDVKPSVPESKTVSEDTKALIKAALLNSKRKSKPENMTDRPRPVTALQRQREREEKRRKKKERALEKKKREGPKGDKAQKGISLTAEDRSLLERWQSMAVGKQAEQPTRQRVQSSEKEQLTKSHMPSVSVPQQKTTVTLQQTLASNPSTIISSAIPSMPNMPLNPENIAFDRMSNIPPLTLAGGKPTELQQYTQAYAGLPNGQDPSMLFSAEKQNPPTQLQIQSEYKPLVDSSNAVAFTNFNPTGYNNQPPTCILASSSNQPFASYRDTMSPTQFTSILQQPTNIALTTTSQNYTEFSQRQSLFMQSSNQPVPLPAELSHIPPSCSVTKTSVSQVPVPLMTNLSPPQINPLLPSKPEIQVSQSLSPSDLTTQSPAQDFEVTDSLQVITKQMMRSHVDDLTLTQTPKGTGCGYGVGLDLDMMLPPFGATVDQRDLRPDSAPLSASLIKDWLDVTGNMDIQDIEALHLELELGSPITSLADFSALDDPYSKQF